MPNTLPSVFLSYARADDELFVRRVWESLDGEGFNVWWDRVSMPSRALTFQHEIRDAIKAHDRVLLILGPAAVTSEYVRAEWQYALAADKVVSSVLRLGTDTIVPPELKSLHYVTALAERPESDALAEILRIARDPPPPVGRPFRIPKPPPHFRPRVDQFTHLANYFALDSAQRLALPASERTVVLQGMTGLGKSVLASSLAKATSTRRQFPDGVLWLSFNAGMRGALQQLRDAAVALGDNLGDYNAESQAVDRLTKRLENAAVMFVLDNVWWDEQVYPFRDALGRRCQMLITTRDAGIATRLEAQLTSLEFLSEEESLVLLADWLRKPVGDLPPVALEVTNECSRLPFALSLVGAMAASGTSWDDLLRALERADLSFIKNKLPDYPYVDLLRAQQASLDFMRSSGDKDVVRAAEKYLEISAFRWQHSVPEAAIVTRWLGQGTTESDARQVLTTVANMALVRTEGSSPNRKISLHDLQQDYLVASNPHQAAEHGAILDAYARKYQGALLETTDDGYYFDSLFYHLERADRRDEMHNLLRREDADGENAWWKARSSRGQVFGFDSDLRAAWRDAERRVVEEPESRTQSVIQLARYALMLGSVRDAMIEVPNPLIQYYLEHGDWRPEQALAAVQWQRSGYRHVEALAIVLPRLDGTVKQDNLEDGLALLRAFPEAGDAAKGYLRLAEGLEGDERSTMLQHLLDLLPSTIDAQRADFLKDVWRLAPARHELLNEALEVLERANEEFASPYTVKAFAQVVPEASLDRLIPMARSQRDDSDRVTALVSIAARKSGRERQKLFMEAYQAALKVENLGRAEKIATVARGLDGESRAEAVEHALQALNKKKDEGRGMALATLLPAMNDASRANAERDLWDAVAAMTSPNRICDLIEELLTPGGLQEVSPTLVQSLVDPLVEAISRAKPGYWRVKALLALAGLAKNSWNIETIEMELRRPPPIDDQSNRYHSLISLCSHLKPDERKTIVSQLLAMPAFLDVTLGVDNDAAELVKLATPEQLEVSRKAAMSREHRSSVAAALAIGFANHRLWKQACASLKEIRRQYELGLAVKGFPTDVPSNVAVKIIERALRSGGAELAARVIPPLLVHIDGGERDAALQYGIMALDYLANRHDRTQLATDLLPYLSCEQVATLRDRLETKLEGFEERPDNLRSRLMIRLLNCGDVKGAVDVLGTIEYGAIKAETFAEAGEISGELQPQFRELAETIAEKLFADSAVRVLVRLAESAHGRERNRLLSKAIQIAANVDLERDGILNPREQKARALTCLSRVVDNGRRREFLMEAWGLAPKGGSFDGQSLLRSLSPQLAALPVEVLVGRWIEDLGVASRSRRAVLEELAALPEVIAVIGGKEAVIGVCQAIDDVARWWPESDR